MKVVLLAFSVAVIFWFFTFAFARAWDYEQAPGGVVHLEEGR